ncbi:hypothetical protein [Pseudomonas sp.]|uniref:hypothetical protein n=1 Tax=Pseudomonas sp. TaxID=306 RepID=UPI00356614F3
MYMQLQTSKAALCALVLLLATLLLLSGVMFGGTVLAGQWLWGNHAQDDGIPRQQCGGGSGRDGKVFAMPARGSATVNSKHILQDLTHQGETPC